MPDETKIKIGDIFKHHKRRSRYEILNFGTMQTKNDLDMTYAVIYKSIDDDKVWIRPLKDFLEEIEPGITRFIKV